MREDRIISKLEEIDGRLATMDGRLTTMDGRLTTMDDRLTTMDGRLTTMDGRLTEMDGRLIKADERQDLLVAKIVEMDTYLHEEVATKAELHATENRLMTHIDGLYKKSDTHETEITAGRARTERLEGRVSTVENTLGIA